MIQLELDQVARLNVSLPAVVFTSQLQAVQIFDVPFEFTKIHCLDDELVFIHPAIVSSAVGFNESDKLVLLVVPL